VGACLQAVPEYARNDVAEFLLWLRREQITHLDLVTPHWLSLIEAAAADPSLQLLPELRWILVGGESVFYRHTRRWFETFKSPARVNIIYGPTEATINATEFEVRPEGDGDKVPIGAPLPNYRLYILDEVGLLCPPGVTGDLYIAGTGVAAGYCSAEATAKSFADDRLMCGRSERVYKTGDLATLVPGPSAGWTIEFRGRADRQVKMSGYRIELEDVEMAARSVPQAADAAVLVREESSQLVCFVAGADVPGTEVIRTHLAGILPGYMVPHLIFTIDRLPLTDNGKIDQEALLARARESLATQADEQPLTATETMMAEIWSQVLGAGSLGRDANFFAAGGSSLLAFRVAADCQRRGLPVRAADILKYQTVAALAQLVTTAEPWIAATGTGDTPAGTGEGASRDRRLARAYLKGSWPQIRDRILARIAAPRHEFTLGATPVDLPTPLRFVLRSAPERELGSPAVLDLGLRGFADADLPQAVADLIRRHPLLNAQVTSVAEAAVAIPDVRKIDVCAVDLSLAGPDDVEPAIAEIKEAMNRHSDVMGTSSLRAVVVACPGGMDRVILSVAHILVDGYSQRHLADSLEDGLKNGYGSLPCSCEAAPSVSQYNRAIRDLIDAAPAGRREYIEDAAKVEARVQDRIRPSRAGNGAVITHPAGTLPEGVLRLGGQQMETTVIAALAMAAADVFGLEALVVGRASHARALPGLPGPAMFLERVSDVIPVLVTSDGTAEQALASACDAMAYAGGSDWHWLGYLSHLDDGPALWPRPGRPLVASVRLTDAPALEVADDGPLILRSETLADPELDGTVELALEPTPDNVTMRVTGWDLPAAIVARIAFLVQTYLGKLGTRPTAW
jgi:nonribosomal peptide synthetase protein VioG